MENESLILSALQKSVTAALAQSDAPALPVKYLLMPAWVPPGDQKWLELVWIPNNAVGDFLGQEMNHRGLFRLVLHWPNAGGGVYVPVNLMASITRYYTNGRVLSGVQIAGKPEPTGMIEDGDQVLFPVTIRYQSYRKGI